MDAKDKEAVISPSNADMSGTLMSSGTGEKRQKKRSKKRSTSTSDDAPKEDSALELSGRAKAKIPDKESVVSPSNADMSGTLMSSGTGEKRQKRSKKHAKSPSDDAPKEESGLDLSGRAKAKIPDKEAVVSPSKADLTGTLVSSVGGEKRHKDRSKKHGKGTSGDPAKEESALELSEQAGAKAKTSAKEAVVSPSKTDLSSTSLLTGADEKRRKKPSKQSSSTSDDAPKEKPTAGETGQSPGKPEGAKPPNDAGPAVVTLHLQPGPLAGAVPMPAQADVDGADKPADQPAAEEREMIMTLLPLIGAIVLVMGLLVAVVVGLLVIGRSNPADSFVVSTTSGHFVGEKVSVGGVEVRRWLGVPYAESTAGDKRFRMSTQPAATKQRTMAVDPRPPCPQWLNGRVVGSEDCLHMNVWAPNGNSAAVSTRTLVLASSSYWFQRGSNNDPDWAELAAKAGVVVMSPNVRLGVLGFLHPQWSGANEEFAKDVAKEDVKAAVKWAVNNAANFGARPDGVVLVGHGSGAYLLAQAAANLTVSWSRAILEGPVPGSMWPLNTLDLEPSKELAAAVGCTNLGTNASALRHCLVNASLEVLLSSASRMEFRFAPSLDTTQLISEERQPVIPEVIAGVDIYEVRSFFEDYIRPAAVATGNASTVGALLDFMLAYFLKNGSMGYKFAKGRLPTPPTETHLISNLALLTVGCGTRSVSGKASVRGYHYLTDGAARPLFEPVLDMTAVVNFVKDGIAPRMTNGMPWEPWRSSNTTRIELAGGTEAPMNEEQIVALCRPPSLSEISG